MRHVLSALVQNVPGVLAHVAGMFASRGYNIDSLAVGETEDPALSRMTFVVVGDDSVLEQVRKQLEKIVTVVRVDDVSAQEFVERDLMLIKVRADAENRAQIHQLCGIFRGKVVDVAPDQVIVEISGQEKKIESFIDLMRPLHRRAGPHRPDCNGPRRGSTHRSRRFLASRCRDEGLGGTTAVDFLPYLHLFSRGVMMRTYGIVGSLMCLLALQLPCAAQNTLKWSFQRTGFRSTTSMPQTALSMRSGQTWPVVYGFFENSLNAYSLFPVLNAQGKNHIAPATNWHQIGSNLNSSQYSGSPVFLQADSAAPDGFAVSFQTPYAGSSPQDVVAIGNSMTGFQSPMIGVQAVKFDHNGNPFTASNSLIPNLPTSQKLYDVATSRLGEVGAITQSTGGGGPLTYWQRSPLLGNAWFSTPVPANDPQLQNTLSGPTVDLLFDDSSRPHLIGVTQSRGPNVVVAQHFDITTGAWISSPLDSGGPGSGVVSDVAAARNDDGIIGAAWVNNGALKYAYLDTNAVSLNWVVTSVATTTPTGVPLENYQGVGLAFDKAGLPVISFVDRTTRQIWVAYDPPSAFGGGVTDVPGAEGDFNGDGFVDGYDLDAWRTGFGEGALSGNDFLAWQRNAAAAPSTTTAAVPEPLTLSSGLVAAVLLFGATRKRRTSANLINISSAERRRSLTND